MNILPKLCTDKEVLYQRKQFQETLTVHGIKAELYPVKREGRHSVYDFYNDVRNEELSYEDPINIRVVFQEVPSIRTLRSLGWYIEDEELPYISYIPTEYIDEDSKSVLLTPIIDDKIVLVDNTVDCIRSQRSYQIKDMRSQGYPNTIYYVAKLVPLRENYNYDNEEIY